MWQLNVVHSIDPQLLVLLKSFNLDYAHRLTALESTVSVLTDAIATLKTSSDAETASLDAAIARVQAEVATFTAQAATLQAQIDALQKQVDSGSADPAVIQALADLTAQRDANKAKLDALNPASPATLPSGGIPVSVAAAKKH